VNAPAPCPHCGTPLNESVVFPQDEVKSCPNCSELAGTHIFYSFEHFGTRWMQGRERLQSWCAACRSDGMEHPQAFMRCGPEQ